MAITPKQLRPVDNEVARLLREAIQDAGISQMAVGEKAGLSQNRVGIISRGERPPATVGEILAICDALGIDGADLISCAAQNVSQPPASVPDLYGLAANDPGYDPALEQPNQPDEGA